MNSGEWISEAVKRIAANDRTIEHFKWCLRCSGDMPAENFQRASADERIAKKDNEFLESGIRIIQEYQRMNRCFE